MTKNILKEAMRAVDADESPFVGDGSTDFGLDPGTRKIGMSPELGLGYAPVEDVYAIAAAKIEAQLAAGVDRAIDKVATTIDDRETTHGSYADTARVAQTLKRVLRAETANFETLTFRQRESIDHICTKLARIACGNANEPDHWLDIQGYARIAVDE